MGDKYHGYMHGRNLVKILKAIDCLSRSGGVSIKELQYELGISRRSVYRLFETLGDLQFPLYDEEYPGEKEKRWHLQEDFIYRLPNLRIPDMKLTSREMLVLYFLLSQDRIFKNTDVSELLSSIRQKLSAIMPSDYLSAAQSDRMDSLFIAGSFHTKIYKEKEDIIDKILEAIVEQKVCIVTYRALSHGKENTYRIHPLRLFEHDGGLYIFVFIPKHNTIRILALDRISKLDIGNETFDEPEDFNPESILSGTFDLVLGDPVSIKVKFTPEGARRVKNRIFSEHQIMEEQDDGSVILSMDTSGRDDVLRWVLSFGNDAKILSPPELRSELKSLLSEMLNQYL